LWLQKAAGLTSGVARICQWGRGSGTKALAARGWESGGNKSSQPPEARESGGGALSDERFLQFFNKNNAFLCIYRLK